MLDVRAKMADALRSCQGTAAQILTVCGKIVSGAPVVLNVQGHPSLHNPFAVTPPSPDDLLSQITSIATRILNNLPSAAPLPDRLVERAARPDTPPQIQPMLHIPSDAPGPEERQAAEENPEQTIREQLGMLSERVSFLASLQVLNRTVYGDSAEAISLAELMQVAGGNFPDTTTSWSFFSRRAWDVSFWTWTRCLFYYHVTASFIPKAVDTCLKDLVNQVQHHLTQGQGSADRLDELIEKFLEHTESLLCDYHHGTVAFAEEHGPTERLEFHRNAAIEARYNNDLDGLCRKCSEELVRHLPSVPLFQNWRETPYLGTLFSPLFDWAESYLNRSLQRKLRESIFPAIFKSLLLQAKNVDGDKETRLRLTNILTNFFSDQLKKLKTKLDKRLEQQVDPRPIQPPRNLTNVVQQLKIVLDLEIYKAADNTELKTALRRREEAVNAHTSKEAEDFKRQTHKAIEEAIHTVCHRIFRHVRDPQNTNQMLSLCMTLCNAPFKRGNLRGQTLEDSVNANSTNLKKLALEVFGKLVRNHVNDIVSGVSPEKETLAQKAFYDQKEAAQALFYRRLDSLLDTMRDKINRQESVLAELAALTEGISAFSNREQRLQEDLLRLDLSYRESLQRSLYPIFEGTRQLMLSLENLKKAQIAYLAQKEVVERLEQIQRHLTPDLETCSLEEAFASLADLTEAMNQLSFQYSPHEVTIRALSDLIYLFRRAVENVLQKRELLNKFHSLLTADRGLSSLSLRRQKAKITAFSQAEFSWENLTTKLLPPEEQEFLANTIRNLSLSDGAFAQTPARLEIAITPLRTRQTLAHTTASASFRDIQERITAFVHESLTRTTEVRDERYRKLVEEMTRSHIQCGELITQVEHLTKEEMFHTTPAVAGAVGWGIVGSVTHLVANLHSSSAALAAAGAVIGLGQSLTDLIYWYKFGASAPLLKVPGTTLAGVVIAGYMTPMFDSHPILSLVTATALSALSGLRQGRNVTTTSSKKATEIVLPEVINTFDRIIDLSTSSVMCHGALSRLMLAAVTPRR